MPVSGRWRIRLAAGLADNSGTAFAVPTLSGGASAPSTAPRVYNITFRTVAQEPPIYTGGQTAGLTRTLRALGSKTRSWDQLVAEAQRCS